MPDYDHTSDFVTWSSTTCSSSNTGSMSMHFYTKFQNDECACCSSAIDDEDDKKKLSKGDKTHEVCEHCYDIYHLFKRARKLVKKKNKNMEVDLDSIKCYNETLSSSGNIVFTFSRSDAIVRISWIESGNVWSIFGVPEFLLELEGSSSR